MIPQNNSVSKGLTHWNAEIAKQHETSLPHWHLGIHKNIVKSIIYFFLVLGMIAHLRRFFFLYYFKYYWSMNWTRTSESTELKCEVLLTSAIASQITENFNVCGLTACSKGSTKASHCSSFIRETNGHRWPMVCFHKGTELRKAFTIKPLK